MYSIEEDEGFAKYKPKWLRLKENEHLCELYRVGRTNIQKHNQNPDNEWYIPPAPKKKEPYISWDRPPVAREPVKQLNISQRKINLADWFDGKEKEIDTVVSQQLQKGVTYETMYDWSLRKRIELRENYIHRLNILEGMEDDDDF